MKFSAHFAKCSSPRFAGHYIPYKLLRDRVRSLGVDHTKSAEFLRELMTTIATLNAYVVLEHESIGATRRSLILDAVRDADTSRRERALWRSAVELRDFAELNYTAIFKIAKKHEKYTGLSHAPAIITSLDAQPFVVAVLGSNAPSALHQLLDSDTRASNIGDELEPSHSKSHLDRDAGVPTPRTPHAALPHSVSTPSVSTSLWPPASSRGAGAPTTAIEYRGRPPHETATSSRPRSISLGAHLSDHALASDRLMRSLGEPRPGLAFCGFEPNTSRHPSAAPGIPDTRTGAAPSLTQSFAPHAVGPTVPPLRPLRHGALALHRRVEGADHPQTPALTPFSVISGGAVAAAHVTSALSHLSDVSAGRAVPLVSSTDGPGLPASPPAPDDATMSGAPSHYPRDTPSGLHWDDSNASAAGCMLQQFEVSLRAMFDFANAALRVVSPQLAAPGPQAAAERTRRLAMLVNATIRRHREVARKVKAGRTLRQIHDVILAYKLELFRSAVKVVMREIELSFPEGAAALEHILEIHFTLFAQYMSRKVKPPSRRRIVMMQRISRQRSVSSGLVGGVSAAAPAPVAYAARVRIPEESDSSNSDDGVHASAASQQAATSARNLGPSRRASNPDMPESHVSLSEPHATSTWSGVVGSATGLSVATWLAGASSLPGTRGDKSSKPAVSSTSGMTLHGTVQPTTVPLVAPSSQNSDHAGLGTRAFSERAIQVPAYCPPAGGRLQRLESEAWGLDTELAPRGNASTREPEPVSSREQLRLNKAGTSLELAGEEWGTMQPDRLRGSRAVVTQHPDATVNVQTLTRTLDDADAALQSVAPAQLSPRSNGLPLWKKYTCFALGLAEWSELLEAAEAPGWVGAALRQRFWVRFQPACVSWLGGYQLRHLGPDVLSGVTIGVLLIPQGLACATLAGLPPVYGLFTGFPAVVYALLGTSRQAAIGPMSIPALLIATSINGLANPPVGDDYVRLVMAITFCCGALMFTLGTLNMGFIVRFASKPVLSGFTSASAILTMASVTKDLLGTPVPRSQVIYEYVASIARALPFAHWPTVLTAALSLGLLSLIPRIRWVQRIPAPLQVVALFIVLSAVWNAAAGLPSDATRNAAGIPLVGTVPSSLPTFSLPLISERTSIVDVFTTAIGVTLVGFVESIAVAQLYAQKHGYDISAGSELKALGLANMFGATIGAFPVMGAFGRSAVNDSTGAKTQLSGIVSAATVLFMLLFVTPILRFLPSAVLAAIVCTAVARLVDIPAARALRATDTRDFLTMLAAFLATLLLGVLTGVIVAIAFSLVIFLAFTTQPKVEELGRLPGTVIYRHLGAEGAARVPGVKIIRFLAPLFFANCSVLRDRLLLELVRRQPLPPRLQWHALVLCLSAVASVDSTAIQALREVAAEAHAAGVLLLLASPNADVEAAVAASGLGAALGGMGKFVYPRVHEAVRALLLQQVSAADLPAPRAALQGGPTSPDIAATNTGGSGASHSSWWLRLLQRGGRWPPRQGGLAPLALSSGAEVDLEAVGETVKTAELPGGR